MGEGGGGLIKAGFGLPGRKLVKCELVKNPAEWKWSSFRRYAPREIGIFELESVWAATNRKHEQKAAARVFRNPRLPVISGGANLIRDHPNGRRSVYTFFFDHQGGTAMKTRLVAISCCITMAAMFAYAQNADEGYQMARVVAFEKVAANAQHMEDSDRYKIAMRLGDTIYMCRASAPAAVFIDWTMGKEFPAKLNDKVLLVKNPNGQVVELNIVGKKKPK
jgi:hypothetical protein